MLSKWDVDGCKCVKHFDYNNPMVTRKYLMISKYLSCELDSIKNVQSYRWWTFLTNGTLVKYLGLGPRKLVQFHDQEKFYRVLCLHRIDCILNMQPSHGRT